MQDNDDIESPAPPDEIAMGANEASEADLEDLLRKLRLEHRRIDIEIKAMVETGVGDVLKIQRMKKIKLSLKDQILFIENQTTPDIIA